MLPGQRLEVTVAVAEDDRMGDEYSEKHRDRSRGPRRDDPGEGDRTDADGARGDGPGVADPVRRRTLQVLGGTLGAAATGTLLAACSRERDPELVTPVPLSDVPVGGRVKVRHQGWPVELQRTESGVTARVLICTHEYCELFWYPKDDVYHCPCHGARYDARGRPQSGPISTPMETIQARIVGDEIHLQG
ncbi:MAG: ubiquinol-cytochrome c reductase iron-sulfur subunit [Acidobacteriota bacterium]